MQFEMRDVDTNNNVIQLSSEPLQVTAISFLFKQNQTLS